MRALHGLFRGRSEIVPGVWVGDEDAAQALWRKRGWTVIDVREFDTEADPPAVIRIPLLRGKKGQASRKAVFDIAHQIDQAIARGDEVLVHCWAGVERSPLALACWLVLSRGLTLDGAYRLITRKRWVADRRSWLSKKARRALARWDMREVA